MLFGPVKVKYLVIFMIVLDFVNINSGQNVGGHYSHLGGAAFGFFFGQEMLKGRDITKGFNLFLDWLFSFANPRRPKMKVTYGQTHKGREKDYHYNTNKKATQAEIDTILEKISRSGYESLSSEERDKLFRASK